MQLKEYKAQFRNLRVPEPKKEEMDTKQAGWYDVYVWVKVQRKKHNRGRLRTDRWQKLKDLGLNFNPKKPIHKGKGKTSKVRCHSSTSRFLHLFC